MNQAVTHSPSEPHQDDEGARLGMWLFIFSELMLFGALFVIYAVYRASYLLDFQAAAHHLNLWFGTVNTLVLIGSSVTMVFSVNAMHKKDTFISSLWLYATITLAVVFLCNKYLEWYAKIRTGIFPNSEALVSGEKGESLFYGLYFLMTGLHAVHIIGGIALLAYAGYRIEVEKTRPDRMAFLENSGLYWHLVDLIWIFLFPLFYLVA